MGCRAGSFPWLVLMSTCIVAAGLLIWTTRTNTAIDHSEDMVQRLQAKFDDLTILKRSVVGLCVLAAADTAWILMLGLWRWAVASSDVSSGPAQMRFSYLASCVLGGIVHWCTLAVIVVLGAVFAVWIVLLYIVRAATQQSAQYLDSSKGSIKTLYNNAENLLDLYESANTTIPEAAKGYVDPLLSLVRKAVNTDCPLYCVDVSGLNLLRGSQCFCESKVLRAAEHDCTASIRAVWMSLIGLALLYVGASFLLVAVSAYFTGGQYRSKPVYPEEDHEAMKYENVLTNYYPTSPISPTSTAPLVTQTQLAPNYPVWVHSPDTQRSASQHMELPLRSSQRSHY